MEQHVQSILLDAGIEVDLKTLQNPTDEFMIDLVMEYLKRFHFDSEQIAKPTPEQLDCVSCEDSAQDAIKAINLYAALSTICEGIFLKDLALYDITSPSGCKKTCKRIQVLFNFLIYVRNKMIEKEPLFNELENRHQEIQNYIDQTAELTIKTGAVIHGRETRLEQKEKIKEEITSLQSLMEKDRDRSNKLQKRVDEVVAKQQEEHAKYNGLKNNVENLLKVTKDLQSKIVKSPEDYMIRLNQLKKILDEKKEERQTFKDAIKRKKKQIENNEKADIMVKEYNNNVTNKIGQIVLNIKKTINQISATKSQIDKLKKDIFFLDNNPTNSNCNSNNSETIDFEKSQNLLTQLKHSMAEKERENDSLKTKLLALQSKLEQIKCEFENENENILIAKKDYNSLVKTLKSHYEEEMQKEIVLRRNIIENQIQENNKF